jgi:hypothetical protein
MPKSFSLLILSLFLFACAEPRTDHTLKPFEYPTKVDTTDQPITDQVKQVYTVTQDKVSADNMFDGARMNSFSRLGKNRYEVTINPENSPINPSPWYAFRIYAEDARVVDIELEYGDAKHRYWPKISKDGKKWMVLDSSRLEILNEGRRARVTLDIGKDTTWLAGQEIINSTDITQWAKQFTAIDNTSFEVIGKSKLGRDMIHLDIHSGTNSGKQIIAVVSRQHPPEVTGNMAMIAFVEEILNDSKLSKAFRLQYRVLVYPMLNPDGVDLGHWRHNAAGIDLNRDWAEYNQPEVRQVCEHIIEQANEGGEDVILGLDFHSTYSDAYYTIADSIQTALQTFANDWIGQIENNLDGFNARISPAAITSPVSKNWFYNQFNAVGIVYEIGDNTPREIIKKKGQVSAQEMMKILINKQ